MAILAGDEAEATERLKNAVNLELMPKEIDFKIVSIELLQEDVQADEAEIEEAYSNTDKRTLN